MRTIKSFEDLEVWQLGRSLRLQLYELSMQLPQQERYNLTPQIRRAAVSLTANIAEGYGRFHFKENAQFCRISRGSAYELMDHLITCKDQGYLKEQTCNELNKTLVRFVQVLNGYIRSIGTRGGDEQG